MASKFSICSTFFTILLIGSVQLSAAGQTSTNELPNSGFEQAADGKLRKWKPYGRGYVIDRNISHSGKQSIKCTATGDDNGMGVVYTINYEKPDKRPITIAGWSKAERVASGGDYCIYLDIIYADGQPSWANKSTWNLGTHDWQYTARTFYPEKPVSQIKAYVFIRRTTGTAWFDDIKLTRGKVGLYIKHLSIASDYPRSKYGLYLSAALTENARWRCEFLSTDGRTLASKTGAGNKIVWLWPGKPGTLPQEARITARNSKGHKLQTEVELPQPPHRQNPVKQDYLVWTQNSMKKVYPTDFPSTPFKTPTAHLTIARNEREGIQIAITPADTVNLKNIQIDVGRFSNPSGDTFPTELIQHHIVGYLWVGTPSTHPLAPKLPNWCPEVLLPPMPFSVPGGRTQTVWLNFFASNDVKPGTYTGSVTIRPANATAKNVTISLRVRRFALPGVPSMKTAFSMMDGFTKHTYGKITPQLRRHALDIMLDHRLNPNDISRTEPPPIEDLLYAKSRGINAFNILNIVPKPDRTSKKLWVWRSSPENFTPDFNEKFAARVENYIAQLRKYGLSKMAYFYGFDECPQEYDAVIKRTCKFLKHRYPEVSIFTTAGYTYQRRKHVPLDYNDYIDWYCPLTSRYSLQLSERLRKIGKQVWWYVCCVPKYPYANFSSIDYPSIEARLLSWMTFDYKVDGLLFWHVNNWGDNKIIDSQNPYLDWNSACILNMTGDGTLTYPSPNGPVSSIRLENIRDGIEDYDYLTLLAHLKGRPAAAEYCKRLINNTKEYSRDPSQLYKVRDQIADEIEAAMNRR